MSGHSLGPTTRNGLVTQLQALGLRPDDVVMVHASMRAIGDVEGRAEGVIRALENAVGPRGTLLMNLGARDDWDWINQRPEAERAALLVHAPAFAYLQTPADPDVGVLAEVFRRMPETLVNDHPDARFGARGKRAQDLVSGLPWHDYYGPGSVLQHLLDAHGKVLRLGADLDTVTLLHYAEYLSAVPEKRRVRRHHLVHGADGPETRVVECLDDTNGIADYPGDDYFGVIVGEYLRCGAAARGRVGRATSELIDARDLVDFAVRWMNAHL